jgi:lysozyme
MLKIILDLLGLFLSSQGKKKSEPAPKPAPGPKPESKKRKVTNQAGLELIKSFEGLYLTSYLCPANVWTIGWGSTGPDIGPNMTWTKEQAEARLRFDLEVFEKGVEAVITVPVTDNQFSAMVSLSYNIGISAFRKSTLLKLLNSKDYQGAADQFLRWNKAGGKELAGLTRRRNAERELFLRS